VIKYEHTLMRQQLQYLSPSGWLFEGFVTMTPHMCTHTDMYACICEWYIYGNEC